MSANHVWAFGDVFDFTDCGGSVRAVLVNYDVVLQVWAAVITTGAGVYITDDCVKLSANYMVVSCYFAFNSPILTNAIIKRLGLSFAGQLISNAVSAVSSPTSINVGDVFENAQGAQFKAINSYSGTAPNRSWSFECTWAPANTGYTLGGFYAYVESVILSGYKFVGASVNSVTATAQATAVNCVLPAMITMSFTFGPLCSCDEDHPHNARGCYMGMCACRVGRK